MRTSSTSDTEDPVGRYSLAAVDDGLSGTGSGSDVTDLGADDDGSGLLIESMTLVEAAPTGFDGMTPINDPSVDRFLTIDEAAAIQPDPTEELALLETRGYRGGWIRAFRTEGGDVAVASVYRFGDATEAEFYLEDGLITIGGYGGEFFDIPGMDGVRGFRQDTAEGEGTVRSLGAAFQRDDRWFLLYIVGSPDTVTPDLLVGSLRSWRSELGVGP